MTISVNLFSFTVFIISIDQTIIFSINHLIYKMSENNEKFSSYVSIAQADTFKMLVLSDQKSET